MFPHYGKHLVLVLKLMCFFTLFYFGFCFSDATVYVVFAARSVLLLLLLCALVIVHKYKYYKLKGIF